MIEAMKKRKYMAISQTGRKVFLRKAGQKTMKDLLEKARSGDKASYIKLVDILEEMYQHVQGASHPLLKSLIGELRQMIWPGDQVAKHASWLHEFIHPQLFNILREKFEVFYKNSLELGNTPAEG